MQVFNRTKIVATIGPASSSKEVLRDLINAGVDVCRLNFSHGAYDDHAKVVSTIHELNVELDTHVAILVDLQGPKLRIGEVEENTVLEEGKEIEFTTEKCIGNASKVYITYQEFPQDVKKGERIMVDDGKLLLEIISTDGVKKVIARVVQGGQLSSKKGVNLPNTAISLPCLTEKDLSDLKFALEQNVQWIGLSFVRSATDIIELKHLIRQQGEKSPRIIAKIEKPEAISDIDDIIKEADGLMVARGDLGVEIPMQNVPLLQKMIVKKCLQASKPVIIATQMMESMISCSTPTRAEVSDVANAVMDGTDAVMLSGETSVGKFPVRVVETMQKIITVIENDEDIYYKHFLSCSKDPRRYISDHICSNACTMAQQVNAKAIITLTHSGYTALMLSSKRPKAPIFVFTDNRSLVSKLSLVWGIRGFYYNRQISTDHTIDDIKYMLKKKGYINEGDLVIFIASVPMTEKGKTNMLKLSHA
ncbi:MAG: pyruvate kinase [Bacteroidetes bacterium]|nr:pyruvate kinase [Bacteroidota bacterium]MBU1717479.1 pyruvate kinase [Bacteroidota bacterium]